MEEQGQGTVDSAAVWLLARNLRRRRLELGLSASALARASGVAKSTVSELERGRGNPAVDTVWALSKALNTPFATLFEADTEPEPVSLARISESRVVATDGSGFIIRHLLSRHDATEFELYILDLEVGVERKASAHNIGVVEHTIVLEGRVSIGPDGQEVEAGKGDCVTFPGDVPHTYRSMGERVRMLSIHEYRKPT
jgi:XRE family transcriptional regulator, regulator of sulfur utilization